MPTISPTKDLLSSLNAKPLEFANRVKKHPELYAKPNFPERPELGIEDGELFALVEKSDSRKVMSASDKDILQMFGAWRCIVFRMEVQAAGNLEVLLAAIAALEAHGESAEDLRSFIEISYGRTMPRILSEAKIRKIAEVMSFQMELLPRHLRTMDRYDAPKDVRIPRRKQKEVSIKQLSMADAYGDESGA